MATFQEIANDIATKVKNVQNFKIGKTGQEPQERHTQEHAAIYKHFDVMATSSDKKAIDDLEIYLIKQFRVSHKNCKNEQDGGGEMTTSNSYAIYLVWN